MTRLHVRASRFIRGVVVSLSTGFLVSGCVQSDGDDKTETGESEEPLSRVYCEAQRDAILAACISPVTPPNLKAACVAAAWIGFVGCLRLPGDA